MDFEAKQVIELVATRILNPHPCGSDCLCRELRRNEHVDAAIRRIHVEKLRSKELANQKSQTTTL